MHPINFAHKTPSSILPWNVRRMALLAGHSSRHISVRIVPGFHNWIRSEKYASLLCGCETVQMPLRVRPRSLNASDLINRTGTAHKECEANGDWYIHPESNKTWSNYTTCVNKQDFEVKTASCGMLYAINTHTNKEHFVQLPLLFHNARPYVRCPHHQPSTTTTITTTVSSKREPHL